jgi:signal transduction histidine kinase
MTQTTKKIFQKLLLIAALAYAIFILAALFGMGSLWSSLQAIRDKVIPSHEIGQLSLKIGTEFKWQVQEWKNLLLRTTDDASFNQNWAAVEENERDVQALTQNLLNLDISNEQRRLVLLFREHHQALGVRYRSASIFFRENGFDIRKTDALVKGADREALASIASLGEASAAFAGVQSKQAFEAADRNIIFSLLGLGVGLLISGSTFLTLARRNVFDPTQEVFKERDAAATRLEQVERLAGLGGLVAGVAHEINTPVGVSLTCATTLNEASKEIQKKMREGAIRKQDMTQYIDQALECSELITSNAYRAANLIQSFKQIAVDQTSEARRSFFIKAYIEEILTSLHPKLKRTAIDIAVHCPSDLRMDSYPGAFAQVLTNLIMNASLHAFEQGQSGQVNIRVSKTGQHGDTLQLVFADNGCGILPEHQSKVFDPFFTTKRGSGGTGLGLNIVHNIVVKILGGSITLSSHVGEGSEFILQLPVAAP